MKLNLAAVPVATIIVVCIAISGALVVLIHPSTLNFPTYVKYVGIAAGILGIGRGLDATHKP